MRTSDNCLAIRIFMRILLKFWTNGITIWKKTTNWIYTTRIYFNKGYSFFGHLNFVEKLFYKNVFSMYYCVKFRPHIVAPPYAWGSWFEEICVYPTRECFHISYSFIGQWFFFLEGGGVFVCLFKAVLLYKFFYLKKYPLWAYPTLGVTVWTNFNLHYLRMIHSSDS